MLFSIKQYLFKLAGNYFNMREPYNVFLENRKEKNILLAANKYLNELTQLKPFYDKISNLNLQYLGFSKSIQSDPHEVISDDLIKDGTGRGFYLYRLNIKDSMFLVEHIVEEGPNGVDIFNYFIQINSQLIKLEHMGESFKALDEIPIDYFTSILKKRVDQLETYYVPFELNMIEKLIIPLHYFIIQNLSIIFATKQNIIQPNSLFAENSHLALGIIRFIFLGLLIKILF